VRFLAAVLSGLVLASSVLAREPGLGEYRAVQESLCRVHPRMRTSWLRARGLDDSYYTTFHRPESTGLRCCGRWPWGSSWELAGRDTFLYLGSGSGVRILSIADSVQPRMLGQINARGLVSQVVVQDSLLFVACGSWGAQIYSVSDPANPRELGSMDAVISDLCVKDTFCYAVGGDSLRIYNVASPSLPSLTGAVRDSGDLVVVANGYAFSAGRWVMNIYNVADPANPTWANSRGGPAYAMFVRRNLLFCSSVQPDNMTILNISDPLNITQVSQVAGYGGDGLFVDDSYAYLPCDYEHSGLFVIDVSDSSHPSLRDSIDPEGVTEWEPYVPRPNTYGYLADDYGGLITLDLHDPQFISEVWSGYKAEQSVNIAVDNGRAYIANGWVGTQIVDVTDPVRPASLSVYDTSDSRGTNAVVARDSFAFVGMSGAYGRRSLRVLDVSDPSHPTLVAEDSCHGWPEDLVLRDSLLYLAEPYQFQVFNVARPREPVRVGSCGLSGDVRGIDLGDTIAYVGMGSGGLVCINIANPSTPTVIGTWGGRTSGVHINDTLAFVAGPYTGCACLSVANPAAPYVIDSLYLEQWWNDVALEDSLVFAGGTWIHVVDASDPRNLRVVGTWTPPYLVRRLEYRTPYLYAACYEGGVCILETVQVGVGEELSRARLVERPGAVCPNPAYQCATVRAGSGIENAVLRDVLGRMVMTFKPGGATFTMDLAGLQPGLYFIELRYNTGRRVEKLIKR